MNMGSGDEVMYESESRTAKKRVSQLYFVQGYIIVIHMGNKQEEGEICSSN
jgi:hypothetical protein